MSATLEPPYNEILRLLREHDTQSSSLPAVRIALLRNVTADVIGTYLRWYCYKQQLRAEVYSGDLDTVVQDVLTDGPLYRFEPQVIIVCLYRDALLGRLIDGFVMLSSQEIDSEVVRVVTHIRGIVEAIRERTDATILINTFENVVYPALGILDYQSRGRQVNTLRRLNAELLEVSVSERGTHLVDFDLLQSAVGHSAFHDNRNWHMARAPYSLAGARLIGREYARFVGASQGRARKCLVLDCDNTLWGGILGEDGLDAIHLGSTYPGSAYVAFQKALLELHDKGVMLALCSKNEERDVLEVFDRRPEMVLGREHFVASRINWNDKATGIQEIARELNIGLDSLVFADDSPFEIHLVRQLLPDVEVVELSGDPSEFCDLVSSRGLFDTLSFSEEDRTRNEMYRAERERRIAATTVRHDTIEDYYRFLEMEVRISDADPASITRVSQLTQKTNQFNLTTRRYTEPQIEELLADRESQVRVVRVKDRFGDSGITGVTVLKYRGGACAIDTLLLSCRVIGRGIEDCLLKDCELLARERGMSTILGRYIPTAKNSQVGTFYATRGFSPTGTDLTTQDFSLSLAESKLAFPAYLKRIGRGTEGLSSTCD